MRGMYSLCRIRRCARGLPTDISGSVDSEQQREAMRTNGGSAEQACFAAYASTLLVGSRM